MILLLRLDPLMELLQTLLEESMQFWRKVRGVYFIGKNEVVIAPLDSISIVDVAETGNEYPRKICNYLLHSQTEDRVSFRTY